MVDREVEFAVKNIQELAKLEKTALNLITARGG